MASTVADRSEQVLAVASGVEESPLPLLAEMAHVLLEGEQARMALAFDLDQEDSKKRIQKFKKVLRREPRNAVRWIDLGREYVILGQSRKSRPAIEIGLSLAPENRFTLRSATAFWVHENELDRALFLLETARSTLFDPWLMSAAIAVADLAGAKIRGRDAQKLLAGDFPERFLAELAAAFGTVEVQSGTDRRGRQLLRRSLSDPTDNSLAQVEWIASSGRLPRTGSFPMEVPRAFEAGSLRAAADGKWEEAYVLGEQWLWDQPFSSDAAAHASFCACEAEDWESAVRIAQAGLEANPSETVLLNNRAFAHIHQGDFLAARRGLTRARALRPSATESIVLAATEGLFLFRLGYLNEGRSRYEAVISAFQRLQDHESAAKAALILAREEVRVGTREAEGFWKRAQHLSRGSRQIDVQLLISKIERLFAHLGSEHAVAPVVGDPMELASPILEGTPSFDLVS